MTKSSSAAGDYEVGYGKPPKEHQFKAGHGKSKGARKKRRQSLQQMVEDVLLMPVSATRKGKPVKVPAIKGVLTNMVAGALQGDVKYILPTLTIGQRFLPQAEEDEGVAQELNETERTIAADALAMLNLFRGEDSHD